MNYYIYRIYSNLLKEYQCYVGLTNDVGKRKEQHFYGRGSKELKKWIQKLGDESFHIEVLDESQSPEKASILEREYILSYDCFYPKGFNRGFTAYHSHVKLDTSNLLMFDLNLKPDVIRVIHDKCRVENRTFDQLLRLVIVAGIKIFTHERSERELNIPTIYTRIPITRNQGSMLNDVCLHGDRDYIINSIIEEGLANWKSRRKTKRHWRANVF